MATYEELSSLMNDSVLKAKVQIGCIVAAETIRGENVGITNHANRVLWAKKVFKDPKQEAQRMLWAVVAANKSATTVQIKNVTDTAIQNNVNQAIDLFANGV